MHRITVSEAITAGNSSLPAGFYLVDNINAGELLSRHPRTITIVPYQNPRPIPAHAFHPDRVYDLNTGFAKILFIRAGGFGDLLFLTPVLRALKAINPNIGISVSCFPQYADILTNNSDISEILPYPLPTAVLEQFDAIVPLENTVEYERDVHAVDRFMAEAGLVPASIPDEEKACLYFPTKAELDAAKSAWSRTPGKPRVGIQVHASARCRSYPNEQLAIVIGMLLARDWEVFLFGAPGSIQATDTPGVTNLTTRGLSIRHSAAVLTTCDVVLAPDSAITHLAGALSLPTVALYGPFPWRLRTVYHPKTFALTGRGDCAPCFHHPINRQHFPRTGPCSRTGQCEVLASIEPKLIAARVCALQLAAARINGSSKEPFLP